MRHYPSNLSEIGLSAAFGKKFRNKNSGYIFHYRQNINGWDLAYQIGKVRAKVKTGIGISGETDFMKGSAIRSEISLTDNVLQATFGIERRFSNELYLLWEYYYNGFGTGETEKYTQIINEGNIGYETLNIGIHFTGINLTYEFSPLLTASLTSILNIRDLSGFIEPYIKYSLSNESDFSFGLPVATELQSAIIRT